MDNIFVTVIIYLGYFLKLCTVLTPFHSTLILTSSPPSGPLSYFTTSTLRLSRLRLFSMLSGSFSTSATLCLWTLSRPWELDKMGKGFILLQAVLIYNLHTITIPRKKSNQAVTPPPQFCFQRAVELPFIHCRNQHSMKWTDSLVVSEFGDLPFFSSFPITCQSLVVFLSLTLSHLAPA